MQKDLDQGFILNSAEQEPHLLSYWPPQNHICDGLPKKKEGNPEKERKK